MEEFAHVLEHAVMGDAAAQITLLKALREESLSVEEQETLKAFLRSQHTHHAIYLRGLLFEYGLLEKQDHINSFLLMREAASKGNSKATYEVARHYLYGLGMEVNYDRAFEWLEIAASSPNYVAEAMYELGRLYEKGLGVMADQETAQKWFDRAHQKGYKP